VLVQKVGFPTTILGGSLCTRRIPHPPAGDAAGHAGCSSPPSPAALQKVGSVPGLDTTKLKATGLLGKDSGGTVAKDGVRRKYLIVWAVAGDSSTVLPSWSSRTTSPGEPANPLPNGTCPLV
jgi:hypothetical protein